MVLLLYVLEEEGESPCPVLYAGFPEEGAFAIFVGGGIDGHAVQLAGRKILSCQVVEAVLLSCACLVEAVCPVFGLSQEEDFVGKSFVFHVLRVFFMDMQRYEIRLRFPKPKTLLIVLKRIWDASRVSESNCIFPLKNNKKLYSSGRIS